MSGRIQKQKSGKKDQPSIENVLKAYLAAQAAKEEESSPQNAHDDEDETETPDNGMGEVETYAEYWPSKLKIGAKHPDPVVCTASLASVQSADIWYTVKLPERIINEGVLSALQLEAVTYASQAHERHLLESEDSQRAGFLIGDGAGVGKGRTIAGIIYENYLRGRKKSIWISVSNDLKYDAQRDFSDIGAPIAVHSLSDFQYKSRITATTGVLFSTYALLIATPGSISKFNSRIDQIVDWCGEDFDGVIVFDECHKAKNLIPSNSLKSTKTGSAVVDLQYKLPNARVVYSSATGATEPRNMAYMVRLGIWGIGTPFRTFIEFQRIVERRGVGAMEVVAMDMKLRGMYVARQLSFQGVTFKVERIPLTEDFIRMYNDSVALWNLALKHFHEANYLMGIDSNILKIIWGQFWGAHQRFFKYLAISAKVDHAVKLTEEAVQAGKCVVIGLQSTGEARMNEELEKCNGELEDYISTAKAVFQSLIEKQFPALDIMDTDSENVMETFEQPSTSRRKKKPVDKFKFDSAFTSRKRKVVKKSKSGRIIKRPRIASSSEDDSLDECIDNIESTAAEDSDSEDEYVPVKNGFKSNRSNRANVAKETEDSESEFDPESESDPESDLSEIEESDIAERSGSGEPHSSSDESSSGREVGRKNKRNSKEKMSKVQEYLRTRYRDQANKKKTVKDNSLKNDIIEGARQLKAELLQKIEVLGERLPKNTLDELVNKLGGSKKVAEMTGRKGRVAATSDGSVQYESRRESGVSLEMLNIKEKERFMSGKKLIAIISEAASSGISLQSDRRVLNQRRRLHMTLELPWAADRAIQQFGRTHRSNQVNAPEYVFLISDLAGEQRFVATVARRLESLGALTHADRRATKSRDLAEFNIDNKYGRKALATTLHAIAKINDHPTVLPPKDYEGDFFADAHQALLNVDLDMGAVADEERKSDNIVRFMNRSLGVPVHLQNHLFKYFSDTLHATILKAKKENSFDPGLMDVGDPARIKRISAIRFLRRHATGLSPIELHTVRVDRGITWSQALERSQTLTKAHEGFYISNDAMNKRKAMLIARLSNDDSQPKNLMMFGLYKPHTGASGSSSESLEYILRNYHKTTPEKAKDAWNHQYEASVEKCTHIFHNGYCKTARFTDCDIGKRITTRVVLSGCVLGVWDRVEKQLRGGLDDEGQIIRMQVCRLRASEGQASAIGILVPNECAEELTQELSVDAEKVENVNFTGELESNLIPKIEKIEPLQVEQPIKLESQLIKIELKSEAEIKTEAQDPPILQSLKCEPESEYAMKSEF
ncbi:protein strawberry notch-like [Bradysia coprophila]|uniref:protein strawberry notch-like n=1 Tax=Bradysia coprophila TaxID=38358 RepID=UPI00187D9B27|nr:protein strawberry notch-like [Bradysia coprophila]